jgi:hypothetical protein
MTKDSKINFLTGKPLTPSERWVSLAQQILNGSSESEQIFENCLHDRSYHIRLKSIYLTITGSSAKKIKFTPWTEKRLNLVLTDTNENVRLCAFDYLNNHYSPQHLLRGLTDQSPLVALSAWLHIANSNAPSEFIDNSDLLSSYLTCLNKNCTYHSRESIGIVNSLQSRMFSVIESRNLFNDKVIDDVLMTQSPALPLAIQYIIRCSKAKITPETAGKLLLHFQPLTSSLDAKSASVYDKHLENLFSNLTKAPDLSLLNFFAEIKVPEKYLTSLRSAMEAEQLMRINSAQKEKQNNKKSI